MAQNQESLVTEKSESPNKRIRQETRRESDGGSGAEEIQEAKIKELTSRRLKTAKTRPCSRPRNGLPSKGTGNNCAQGHH